MTIQKWIIGLGFLFFRVHGELTAAETADPAELNNASHKEVGVLNPKDEETVVTTHSFKLNGQELQYTATAGTMTLKDETGAAKASIFYVSYIKEDLENRSRRPLTFCFNGGPGSSSIWLHMGMLGPKRVDLRQDAYTPPPYTLVDNQYSLLDVTDLVFIDPVSTGFSRAASGKDPKQFHGVEEDIKSVAEFIQLFTTQYNRWDSPKFLAGESYGTIRAAGLASHLLDEYKLYLNGIVLISSVLNFQTIDFDEGNDLAYILFLPSYTATAWYHKRLAPELQENLHKTLKEAEDFSLKEYATALLLGDALEKPQRDRVIEKLARYTGLSAKYIQNSDLRIPMSRFSAELLREEKRTVGRYDSRFLGILCDACNASYNYDPSTTDIFGAFTGTFMEYIHTDLKWKKNDQYKVLTSLSPWNYGTATNSYLNVSGDLRDAMTKSPTLQVYVACGYYDLATPYFATRYTFNHLKLDPSLKAHFKLSYFDAGHMMYIHLPSLEKLKKELVEFYKKA
jgi:carboxypeptidase C (cathepsin A)